MYVYVALILSIIFNSAANILIKFGMAKISPDTFPIFKVIFNPLIISGAASFGLSLICYCYVLRHVNLSIAYPIITSVCFMLVVLFSWLFLKEKLLLTQAGGFVLIIFGIWLVAKGI